jgi:DNA-binding transcriptional regulator GbsR (MarR family)
MSDHQSERERDFVDQIALALERSGLAPVAGRLLGRLLICEPAVQSSADLADYLGTSAGSVSTSTRMLMQIGLIERVRKRGSRAAWFRVREGAWAEIIHAEIGRIRRLRELADRGLEVLPPDCSPERRRRMQDFRDFNAFFEREFPILIQHWDAREKKEEP